MNKFYQFIGGLTIGALLVWAYYVLAHTLTLGWYIPVVLVIEFLTIFATSLVKELTKPITPIRTRRR